MGNPYSGVPYPWEIRTQEYSIRGKIKNPRIQEYGYMGSTSTDMKKKILEEHLQFPTSGARSIERSDDHVTCALINGALRKRPWIITWYWQFSGQIWPTGIR